MMTKLELIIMRHGEAEPQTKLGDHARQLTERGQKDVQLVAIQLARRAWIPDKIIVSDAARAFETASIVQQQMRMSAALEVAPAIYEACLESLLSVLRQAAGTAQRLLIVGHNPGLSELLSWCSGQDYSLRTAEAAYLQLAVGDSWESGLSVGKSWTLVQAVRS